MTGKKILSDEAADAAFKSIVGIREKSETYARKNTN